MSDKYLIKPPLLQEAHADPQVMAQGLGMLLLSFLGSLLFELDHRVDKRLIRTLVQAVEAILTFRDQMHGLLLSELGAPWICSGQGAGEPNGSAGCCIATNGRWRSSVKADVITSRLGIGRPGKTNSKEQHP